MYRFWRFKQLNQLFRTTQNGFFNSGPRIRPNYTNFKANSLVKGQSNSSRNYGPLVLVNFSIWKLFKKDDGEEETPEQKLIMTIKRSILSIQREEYEKAERILHLALRMAQDLNSKDGVTYVYDVMANMALERGHFEKAEKLFVDIMKRLFADGLKEDDIKMLAISSKIAFMAEMSGQLEKAKQGFEWTLKKLEEKLKVDRENMDLLELWGMTKNWYGQTLLQMNVLLEAKQCFKEAYEVYQKVHDKITEEGLMILNNLGVVCTNLGELDSAEDYLVEALKLSKEIPDYIESAVFRANLGLVYLKKGLVKQATDICSFAWRVGTKADHKAVIEQSNYCLEQIKEFNEKN